MLWGYIHSSHEQELAPLFTQLKSDKELEKKILTAKTYNDVAALMAKQGFKVSGVTLLLHQAQQIVKLDDEKAEKVA